MAGSTPPREGLEPHAVDLERRTGSSSPERERETERERYFARLTARAFHPEILGDRARRKSGEEKGTDLSLCLSLALELRIPSRQSMKSLFTRVGRDSRSITREPREHDIRKWCVVALLSTDD